MKKISAALLGTLMTGTLALGVIAPASAQDAPPPAPHEQSATPGQPFAHPPRPMRQGNGDLLNFARGAEAIEVALVRLSHRLDLTADQTSLLEALKTSALDAAAGFETATKDLRPTPPAPGAEAVAPKTPDFSKNLEARIALSKANVAALEAIKPAYDAFFSTLTDEQKAKLMPERGDHGRGGPGPKGQHAPHRN